MAEGKGHTELPWSINPHHPRLINGGQNLREVAKTSFGTDEELAENTANANLIVTAVNTYPAVEGLVEALEFISDHINDPERGPRDLYPAFGLDATQAKEVVASALSRFRSLQNGGAE